MDILIIENSIERVNTLKALYSTFEPKVAPECGIAKKIILCKSLDLVHLDFDLNETTTEELAPLFPKETLVVIHSENPDGVEVLRRLIENAIVIPFYKFARPSPFLSHLKATISRKIKSDIMDQLTRLSFEGN